MPDGTVRSVDVGRHSTRGATPTWIATALGALLLLPLHGFHCNQLGELFEERVLDFVMGRVALEGWTLNEQSGSLPGGGRWQGASEAQRKT